MDLTYSYFPGCTLKTKAKDLDICTRETAAALGVTLVEIDNWQCCGGVYPLGSDEVGNKLASVRALNDAKEHGRDLVTVCSGCFHVLKRVNDDMKNVSLMNPIREKPKFCTIWNCSGTLWALTRSGRRRSIR